MDFRRREYEKTNLNEIRNYYKQKIKELKC